MGSYPSPPISPARSTILTMNNLKTVALLGLLSALVW